MTEHIGGRVGGAVSAPQAEVAVPCVMGSSPCRSMLHASEHHATAVGMSRDELSNLRLDDFTPLVPKPDLEQG